MPFASISLTNPRTKSEIFTKILRIGGIEKLGHAQHGEKLLKMIGGDGTRPGLDSLRIFKYWLFLVSIGSLMSRKVLDGLVAASNLKSFY